MSKRRATKWILGLALVAGIAGGVLLLQRAPVAWVSDPAAIRPWSERSELLNPVRSVPPTINSNLLQSLTIITNETGTLRITHDEPDRNEHEHLAWQVVEADDSQHADLGAGGLTLEYVGVAYGPPDQGRDDGYSLRLDAHFFRPDGTPFEAEDYQRCELDDWDRKLRYRDGIPAVEIGLKLEGVDGYEFMGLKAFDARTHAPIQGGGFSHGGSRDRYAIETSLAVWHPAPIELVLDLAVGPPEVFEFPAKPGAFQGFPGGAIALAAGIDGDERSWSSSSDGKQTTVTVRFEENERQPQCSLIFLCFPAAHPAPFEFELLNEQEEVLPSAGGGSSSAMAIKSARAKLSEVATVRLLYYPNQRRVLFRLPALPGLPAENANVANLFDLHVPYVAIRYEHDLQEWVQDVLQLKIDASSRPNFPPGTFPMAFTNTTAADLFQVWMDHQPQGMIARVNAETQTLEVRKSGAMALLERLREWFAGKFR
ncbi:MAG: hypothetical protein KDM81_08510 [Verrucomicrobiae bacterium]|nr:hypothetical protein [Verrucomicrobiae bacterium]